MIYQFGDKYPTTTKQPWQGWVADTATVLGQVELGERVSVWFGAVIRGDNALIRLGDFSNVQENVVIHTDAGLDVHIGAYVTIGHQAMIHGCSIGDNSLIGMNAVVLNRAVIGKNCIIGANALVPEGKVIPDNSVVMGSPAKIVKTVDPAMVAKLRKTAEHYAHHYERFKTELKPFSL